MPESFILFPKTILVARGDQVGKTLVFLEQETIG